MPSEEVFEMVAKFASSLASAHADNESRKRREAYQAKRNARDRVASVVSPASTPRVESPALAQRLALDAALRNNAANLNASSSTQELPAQGNAGDESVRTHSTQSTSSTTPHGEDSHTHGGIDSILQEIQSGGPDALLARRPTLGNYDYAILFI